MKNFFKPLFIMAALAVTMTIGAQSAKADNVTFSTSGAFTSPGGTVSMGAGSTTNNVVTFGNPLTNSLTLTFNGSASATLNTTTVFQAGDILATSTGTGAMITTPTTLTITINQTAPTVGTGTLVGTLTGTISQNQSSGLITFASSTNIGGFTYSINRAFDLNPPSSGTGGGAVAGDTSIQGIVSGSAVPEPASMLLLGTGLTGLAGIARRRRMK